MRHRHLTSVIVLAAFGLWPHVLEAQSAFPIALSSSQQLSLARVFAPTLVFHADEQYFPTSSMPSSAADTAIEGWSSRLDQYRALSVQDKLGRAALAYRVFSRVQDGEVEVVIEYWCYYPYNAFTVRGGWLPFRMSGNHPHDLERLYLMLGPTGSAWQDGGDDENWARESFRVRGVVANAHDGSIPPNQYQAPDGESVASPVTVLVERGSHAMAPDLNNDGRFTPGVDSTVVSKLQWGIRDRGSTWRWYRESFMDGRGTSAVRLCGPAPTVDAVDDPCPRYTLYPSDGLQRWFQDLQLSEGDLHEVVGRTPWLVRTFGDFRVEGLMVPADPADGQVLDKMLGRRSRTERGFVAGFTTVDHSPTVVVGRRAFWEVPARHAPDILAEAVAMFSSSGRTLVEATVWGSYRLDAITNVVIGLGWFSESESASMTAGVEVRIGRFRIRPAWRFRDRGFDSRVTTTF
ncbi:MAG TPA: hypothetical protein VIY56_18320 [Vicinamibacterales bacterium]